MLLDRYLTRVIAAPLFLILALLFSLFVTYTLTRFLTEAAAGVFTLGEVMRITLYRGTIALEVLTPISLYIAIIVGLGKLYSDYEMDALSSAGVSQARLLRPILIFAALIAILVWLASMTLRPWAYNGIFTLKAASEGSDDIDRIKPGQFYHFDDSNRTVFVSKRSVDGELQGIFVRTRSGDGLEVVAAPSGRMQASVSHTERELLLRDARIFKTRRDEHAVLGEIANFQLRIPQASSTAPKQKPKSQPSATLAASSLPGDRAEYQWRLSTGLSTLLLALLAVPLSRSLPRQGRYAKLMIAVSIYAGFYILLGVARTWVEQGATRTLWWAPGLLAIAVGALYVPARLFSLRSMPFRNSARDK